jgi:hypothetical protein
VMVAPRVLRWCGEENTPSRSMRKGNAFATGRCVRLFARSGLKRWPSYGDVDGWPTVTLDKAWRIGHCGRIFHCRPFACSSAPNRSSIGGVDCSRRDTTPDKYDCQNQDQWRADGGTGRVARGHCCPPAPSERPVTLSRQTAQAAHKAPW